MKTYMLMVAFALVLGLHVGPTSTSAQAQCRFIGGAGKLESEVGKGCGGAPGLVAGLRIGLLDSSAQAGYVGRPYGSVKGMSGTMMAAATVAAVKAYLDTYGVPWPKADTPTARRHARTRYNLYQIYYVDKKKDRVDAFKFGITRAGKKRPTSQLRFCARHPKTHTDDCRYKWVRVNIKGWHRARRIEGAYCARYVAAKGRRPHGMARCL